MSYVVDASAAARLTEAMALAQSGAADRATAALKVLLGELGGTSSHERAAAEYVLAIAAFRSGDLDQAGRACAGCITIGRALDEPGWVANGLALNAVLLHQDGQTARAVDDLVAAEYALARCEVASLAAWAHTGLGNAYEAMRFFELAVPHHERAIDIGEDPFPMPESRFVDAGNIASVTLAWSVELEMLADPAYAAEIADLRRRSARWAQHSIDLGAAASVAPEFLAMGGVQLAMAAWPDDPERSEAELLRCRTGLGGVGHEYFVTLATAGLARARAARGDDAQAAADAREAMAALTPLTEDYLERFVRWTALTVAAARGDRGAAEGLAYGRSVSTSWWRQRTSELAVMRTAIATYEESQTNAHDRRAAREDPLTGLGNRRALDEFFAEATRRARSLAVILVDVDGLKSINDTWGHAAGDDVLATVADVIARNVRAEDIAVRHGGDEFVIVLVDPESVDPALIVDRIGMAIGVASITRGRAHLEHVGVSFGIATSYDSTDAERLIAIADERMYDDKRRKSSGAVA